MTIAVLSDIHDNIWNLERALKLVDTHKTDALLFLGDFCAPFTLAQIASAFDGPIHAVFGNNDGDPFLLGKIASGFPHVALHGQFADLTLGERRIALNHYPEIAEPIARSGIYDTVFSGHDHKQYVHTFDETIWANPGEVMGRFGEPSIGVYDTARHEFRHVPI